MTQYQVNGFIHQLENDISNIFNDYQNAMLDMELCNFYEDNPLIHRYDIVYSVK